MTNDDIEIHPWPPFIPDGAKVLLLGTFPPGKHRWSMDFYYPNPTNDFWKVCGFLFMGDPKALYIPEEKRYDLPAIKKLLKDKGIALNDTGRKIRRLKGNASDKFLEILEPVDLRALLLRMPNCHTLATTGEKAAGVIATLTGSEIPKMGEYVMADFEISPGNIRTLQIWRMPSTSRAYPLRLEKKADYYARLFRSCDIL